MRVSILLKDESGNFFDGQVDLKLRKSAAQFAPAKHAQTKARHRSVAPADHPRTPTDVLRKLHQKNVFKTEKEFKAVEEELAEIDCNFPKPSLAKALERADFLTRHGKRGSYRWIQKYPPGA
jgi:hypothetical protein